MTFPFWSLVAENRELGLFMGVVIGFAFGFVLERAGFGRAPKLMGQFYGYDLAVLKVMFSAVVVAMLGAVILSGAGLMDWKAVADNATSETFLWPMIIGGFVLGVGFVVSGYCPGTSVVATASGKLDGLATVGGVVVGGLIYAELEPAMGAFPNSGELGTFTIPEWLGLPAPVVAALVVAMAIGAFLLGEMVERRVNRQAVPAPVPVARRWVFVALVALAVVAVLTLALPTGTQAGQP